MCCPHVAHTFMRSHTNTHSVPKRPFFFLPVSHQLVKHHDIWIVACLSGSTLSLTSRSVCATDAPKNFFHLLLSSPPLISSSHSPPTRLLLSHPLCRFSAPSLSLPLLPPLFSLAEQSTADLSDQPPPLRLEALPTSHPSGFHMYAESVWSSARGGGDARADRARHEDCKG